MKPVDWALGVAVPLHSHITFNMVVSDYVPPFARGAARAGVLGTTLVGLAGLAKLNWSGPGVTGAVRALWK